MKESPEEKRRRLIELAKASVTSAYSTGEHSAILAINTYNEVERTRNLIHEKLEDWYGIFFPELRLNNQITYAKFVAEFGRKKRDADRASLEKLLGTGTDEVYARIQSSIGNDPNDQEYETLRSVANTEIELGREQDLLDAYLKERITALMPNISYLIDYKLAAELLSKAGSLSKLALMPASTIQLLGAEKSLFKHIRFNTRPPKYGVLFRLPEITTATRGNRGRIARLYATKICIASKADAFTKNFIAPKLKEQIDATLKRYSTQRLVDKPERPEQQGRWQSHGRGRGGGNFRRQGSGRNSRRKYGGGWQDHGAR